MRELHLFAGCGGGLLSGMLLGHTCVCAVEIDAYCRKVLLQRQRYGILPRFPIWDDVRTFSAIPWRGLVDIIHAGFPCKGISSARSNNHINGALVGIGGAGSELWEEIPRIASECGYPDLFIENSPRLLTRGLVTIIKRLASIGYVGKWCCLGAGHFGADHERVRLWLKATHPNGPQQQRGELPGRTYPQHKNFGGSSWWENQPGLERVANGLADNVDFSHRLKAIGNGQVSIVGAAAWNWLT